MEEPETEIVQPCDFIDVSADCDRSGHHRLPVTVSSIAVKEERGSINSSTVAVSPSSCTKGDRVSLGHFYTPSNHGASPSFPSLHSSSQMAITRHSQSLSSMPAPVESAPTPLSFPAAPTARGSSPGKEQPVARAVSTCQGGQGTPKKSPKSVSRLCFPFVTTSSKRKNKVQVPGKANLSLSDVSTPTSVVHPSQPPLGSVSSQPRHKFSCPPTRFSPLSARRASPSQKPPRHTYANHGYSHEALEHVKSFWSVRREGGTPEKKPQVARTVHPQSRGSVGEPSPGGPTSPSTPTSTDPEKVPASIHPRRGDISSLRDPQCVEVDRTFGVMGVWTIAKMVWMVEVDVGVERMEREAEKERRRRRSRLRVRILWGGHDSDDGDEGALDASNRTTSMSSLSDDSEMTLVDELSCSEKEKDEDGRVGTCASDTDDDDDDEGLQMVIRGRKFMPRANSRAQGSSHSAPSGYSNPWTTLSASPGRELLDLNMDMVKSVDRSLPQALYQTRLEAIGAGRSQSEWATDWTSRWEIVRTLSQEVVL